MRQDRLAQVLSAFALREPIEERLRAHVHVAGPGAGAGMGGALSFGIYWCDLALFKLAPRLQIALREGL